MRRKTDRSILLVAIAAALTPAVMAGSVILAGSARAQFGGIFGDPPRPPGNIPRGRDAPDTQGSNETISRPQRPARREPQYTPPPPLENDPAVATAPPPRGGYAPGGVQGQSLAPPPGIPAETAAPPAQAAPSLPAGATAGAASAGGGGAIVPPSPNKIVNPTAVFAGLDKVTGRITSFDVQLNETVQFGALQVTPRACYTRPPTETAATDTFVEVDEVTLKAEVKRIFSGWMFAASPGLHGVEHPIYDVWLTDCKGGAQAVAEIAPPPAPAAAAPPPRATTPQRQPARAPSPARAPAPPSGTLFAPPVR